MTHAGITRRWSIAAAAAGLTAGVLLPVADVPSAGADACPDADVVFARGTDDSPGLGRVGNSFVSSLRSKVGDRSVGTYAVNYPATFDFRGAVDGANDASGHIQQMVNDCPNTKLVLGGYSQGAAVIDIITAVPVGGFGFSQPLPPQAADHVAAVVLLGNPSGRVPGLLTTLSPEYAGKTIDLCATGDAVCSGGDNFAAHREYVQSGLIDQAASFAAARL